MHLDIIWSLTLIAATQEICQLPKLIANKYGGSRIMVNPSAHPHNMNILKHILYLRKTNSASGKIYCIEIECGSSTTHYCFVYTKLCIKNKNISFPSANQRLTRQKSILLLTFSCAKQYASHPSKTVPGISDGVTTSLYFFHILICFFP
jgi:hypothetical protein